MNSYIPITAQQKKEDPLDYAPLTAPEENSLYIADSNHYQELKNSLAQGIPLNEQDIERLAFTLGYWCRIHCDECYEEDDLDNATQDIQLLFTCFSALPGSETVQEALCASTLAYIDEAGGLEDFTAVHTCLAKLRALATAPTNASYTQKLTRTLAHAMVLTIVDLLDSDSTQSGKTEAQKVHNELEQLVRTHTHDLVLPTMLAWSQRMFLLNCSLDFDEKGMQSHLAALYSLQAEFSDNVLIAGEYAIGLHCCFDACLSRDGRETACTQILSELKRIVQVYGEAYRAFAAVEPDNPFPAYTHTHNLLDEYLTQALCDASAHDTEKDDLQAVLNHKKFLEGFIYPPEAAAPYLEAMRQIVSNLSLLYGRRKEYAKASESIQELQGLITEDKDAFGLADALYNLISKLAQDDIQRYQQPVESFLEKLFALAARTNAQHEHTRYAMALYNVSVELEKAGMPHQQRWDELYAYGLEHPVGAEMVCEIATEEASMVGRKGDMDTAQKHWKRTQALCVAYHSQNMEIARCLAISHYNLLIVADKAGAMSVADAMLQKLMQMVDEYSGREEVLREIVLRLAKGAVNLVTSYGNQNNIPLAEKIYTMTLPYLLPHQHDNEITLRLCKMALNLCVDFKNAKGKRKIRHIAEQLKELPTTGEAAGYMKEIRKMGRWW